MQWWLNLYLRRNQVSIHIHNLRDGKVGAFKSIRCVFSPIRTSKRSWRKRLGNFSHILKETR